jgi:tetratricopeptide (TPR) repeat protein
LDWEKRRFPFNVEFDVAPIVLASMRNELRSTGGFGWQGYNTAANYCLSNNTNLEEGLKWAEASIANTSNFNNLNTKARIQTALGKSDDAKQTMDLAMEQGNPFQIHQYGRILIGQEKLDEAMEVFEYNAKKHENTWPVNVGLARGLSAKGDYKGALKYMQKALENAPAQSNKDNVQANIDKLEKGEDIN